METEKQKQTDWVDSWNSTPMPCPSCGTNFCLKGNEFGECLTSDRRYSPMARCPQCHIVFTEALGLTGDRWWTPVTDLTRIKDHE